MFRQGPIPAFVHGVVEYLAAALLIAAPFLFTFEDDTATAVSIVVGVLVLAVTASTALPTGLIKSIPVQAHVVIDYLLAGLLIAAPFLFGFSSETAPLIFFIALGVVHLLLTIATRFVPEGAESQRRGRRGGRRESVSAAEEPQLGAEGGASAEPASRPPAEPGPGR